MKLTKEDKELLLKWGHRKEDLDQIEKATTKTEYELENEKITLTEVLQVLDRETYLSGISRSAFTGQLVEKTKKGKRYILILQSYLNKIGI